MPCTGLARSDCCPHAECMQVSKDGISTRCFCVSGQKLSTYLGTRGVLLAGLGIGDDTDNQGQLARDHLQFGQAKW